MGVFGPGQDEVWRQLSREIGAEFVECGFRKRNKVQAHVGPWTVTLDTYSDGQLAFTRIRAPYVNTGGFRFKIYRKSLRFSDLDKLLGMEDIEVGDPEFDDAFIIRGNYERQVRELFANPKIRKMIQAQPALVLKVEDSKRWVGPRFPRDVDELILQGHGVINDVGRLKVMFELFAAVLDQLWRIGSASEQTPGVDL